MRLQYEIDMEGIGERFKIVRKRLNYIQAQLAEAIGIDTTYLSKIENGHEIPSLPVVIKFAKITGCDLNYVLLGSCPRTEGSPEMVKEADPIDDVYKPDLSPKGHKVYSEIVANLISVLEKNEV